MLSVWSAVRREQALKVLSLDYVSEEQFCVREGRRQYFLRAGTSMGYQLLDAVGSACLVNDKRGDQTANAKCVWADNLAKEFSLEDIT